MLVIFALLVVLVVCLRLFACGLFDFLGIVVLC